MNLLLTNDDGIFAPGITTLAQFLCEKHNVTIAAPLTEMSGASHAFTLFSPLTFVEKTIHGKIKGFGIRGTPSDCVKVAVTKLLTTPPDLLLSGINWGENTGVSSFYSGTVAAAREGLFFGLKSISVSLSEWSDEHLAYAIQWLSKLIDQIESGVFDFDGKKTFLNINFPPCPPSEIAGHRFTRQGMTPFDDNYEERVNPSGGRYFWLYGKRSAAVGGLDDDDRALSDRFIAITPLTVDMTDHQFLERHKRNGTPNL